MKKLLLVYMLSMCSVAASAQTITFDDISVSNFESISNGYAGFNWDNFGVENSTSNPGTGYDYGTVSGTNVAFNMWGETSAFSSQSSPFTFNSAYFTGAWNDGLSIQVDAFLAGALVNTMTFVVNSTGPTLEIFNWSNIDRLTFTSSGGTSAQYGGVGPHFAMDDMVVNEVVTPVPEPSTYAMMLVGLGLVGFSLSRRKGQGNAMNFA